jgi:UDP-N-acetylmuramoylalanine--D-glutamate ligase
MNDIERARVLIIGFGVEGFASYEYLRTVAPGLQLGVFDESKGEMDAASQENTVKAREDTGTTWYEDVEAVNLSAYDIALKSPGIPPNHPLLVRARMAGLHVVTQMEILFERVSTKRLIGVTGTKGKSTTSTLLAAILDASGVPVSLIGNIGTPVIPSGLEAGSSTMRVIEMSSYQLSSLRKSPHISILLEIVPEHLNYHGSLDAYVEAKENIVKFQEPDDFSIFNTDSPISSIVGKRTSAMKLPISIEKPLAIGGFVDGEMLTVRTAPGDEWLINRSEVPLEELPGRFNLYNVLAAMLGAKLAGATVDGARAALARFKALPHRLQVVGDVHGIRFIDNSIATVPSATIAALETIGDNVQTLILGGFDRGVSYEALAKYIISETAVRNIALLPENGTRIAPMLIAASSRHGRSVRVKCVESMRDAVQFAFEWSEEGSVCLLSPAAPSFGLFRDYRDRGDAFRDEALRAR